MDIKLYYISGISKEDTPYFATRDEQNAYFANRQVAVVENTWYPPYYKNEIYFDTSVLNTNTQANYLSLEYNNKVYYYFINAIRYRSEEVISINIEMDSIQTFMFDFSVTSAIIERKCINRWVNEGTASSPKYVINRNYLRENVSQGVMVLKNTEYHKYDQSCGSTWNLKGFIAVTRTTKWNDQGQHGINYTPNGDIYARNQSYLFLVPIFQNKKTGEYGKVFWAKVTTDTYIINNTIESLSNDSGTIEAHYIPGMPFNGFELSEFSRTSDEGVMPRIIPEDGTNIQFMYNSTLMQGCYGCLSGFELNPLKWEYLLNARISFVRNTHIGNMPDNLYETSLLDENYYRVEFGENNTNCTYPLYQLKTTVLHGIYYADLLGGYRYYQLIDEYQNATDFEDKYHTLAKTPAPLYAECITDSWKDWVVNNRGTMLITSADTMIQGVKSFVNGLSQGQGAGFSSLKAVDSMWDASKGTLKRYFNAKYAPDSLTSTGSISADMLSHNADVHFSYWEVDDINQVAQYYRRYGNLVNEYIDTEKELFKTINTRYYFNYIKLAECDVHLSDYLETNDVTGSIKDRLVNGIRLWNVDKTDLCDYSYDNVEKDFVS